MSKSRHICIDGNVTLDGSALDDSDFEEAWNNFIEIITHKFKFNGAAYMIYFGKEKNNE